MKIQIVKDINLYKKSESTLVGSFFETQCIKRSIREEFLILRSLMEKLHENSGNLCLTSLYWEKLYDEYT